MIKKKWVLGAFIFFILLTLIPFVLEFVYPDAGFVPKGDALKQNGPILWAHIATDFLIGIAYVSITLSLLYIIKKAGKSIPFSWVFVMFGLFIIACGFTHFMGVFVVWKPWYWIEAGVQYFTVVVSLGTAIAIVPLTPKIFKLIDSVNASEHRKKIIFKQNNELLENKKQLERKLKLAQKVKYLEKHASELKKVNKLKNLFLSMTSHELKTPITPIKSQAENLLAELSGKLNKEQKQSVKIILRNTNHLNDLLSDVLDSAKLEANQLKIFPEITNLKLITNETIKDVEQTSDDKHITITSTIEKLPLVMVDTRRFRQVLLNLLTNSIKFTPKNGKIDVSIKKQDQQIFVTVTDTGVGISKNMIKNIFDKFVQGSPSYRLKQKGTGLGLTICKGIVTKLGGKIWAQSKGKNKGASFHFTIPLKTKKFNS
jgi:signal transduction histidine kinase